MPCNSEYMNPNNYEKKISRVACLLDELKGIPIKRNYWDGYYPSVYCQVTRELGDALVAELCAKLKETDVTKYSLEMQIWWRDHQRADAKRLEKEALEEKHRKDKESAIAKLTASELDALWK